MSLAPGERLGPYEIVAPIGAGGMGVVYRARDPRLDRSVAIKVLPKELAGDRERLARFEREARAASALEHPNIVTVHDVGTQGELPYVVLELVDGPSLRQELREKGALPLRRALEIGTQIARGLAAAHENGIIHRDLKPENVLLAREGRVKIVDFGLARWAPALHDSASELAAAPTVEQETDPGAILGTVGYMSPEQARGRTADARSDLFALGCILYELLSGRRAFAKDTAADTLSSILRDDPPPLAQVAPNRDIPPVVELVVRRCLEKNSGERFQSARDLAFELELLTGGSTSAVSSVLSVGGQSPGRWRTRNWIWPAAIAAPVAIAFAGFVGANFERARRAQSMLPVYHWELPAVTDEYTSPFLPEIAPDGSMVAFAAFDSRSGDGALFVRPLASAESRRIGDGGLGKVWTPDSRRIYYRARNKLFRASADGKLVEELCSGLASVVPTTAGENGLLLGFDQGPRGGIVKIDTESCATENLVRADSSKGELFVRDPQLLPEGSRFLYYVRSGRTGETRLSDLTGGTPRTILRAPSRAVFAPPHFLLFERDATLFSQQVDPETFVLVRNPVAIAREVLSAAEWGDSDVSASNDGTIAFRDNSGFSRLYRRDALGNEATVATGSNIYLGGLSPDGSMLAVSIAADGQKHALWRLGLADQRLDRLSPEGENVRTGVWLPNGRHLAYTRESGIEEELLVLDLQDTTSRRPLFRLRNLMLTDSSPDGSRLLFDWHNPETASSDVWQLPLDGTEAKPVVPDEKNEWGARISPNGAWLAFVSDRSGKAQAYLKALINPRPAVAFGPPSVASLHWRRDAPAIQIATSPDERRTEWWEIDVTEIAGEPLFGEARRLFSTAIPSDCIPVGADVWYCVETDLTRSMATHVVVNWTSLLPRD